MRLPTTLSVAGSIRVTRLPGALVTQIESSPTASIVAGSGNVMTAVTKSVVGSILATVPPGPLEIQIEPKAATTSWADGWTSVATRVPPGGSSGAGLRILFEARAARTATSAKRTTPPTPMNSFREFTCGGYSPALPDLLRPLSDRHVDPGCRRDLDMIEGASRHLMEDRHCVLRPVRFQQGYLAEPVDLDGIEVRPQRLPELAVL